LKNGGGAGASPPFIFQSKEIAMKRYSQLFRIALPLLLIVLFGAVAHALADRAVQTPAPVKNAGSLESPFQRPAKLILLLKDESRANGIAPTAEQSTSR